MCVDFGFLMLWAVKFIATTVVSVPSRKQRSGTSLTLVR